MPGASGCGWTGPTSSRRSFLLRGLDLRSAEQWLAQAAGHEKVPPTDLQAEYILASRKAAIRNVGPPPVPHLPTGIPGIGGVGRLPY